MQGQKPNAHVKKPLTGKDKTHRSLSHLPPSIGWEEAHEISAWFDNFRINGVGKRWGATKISGKGFKRSK